MTITSKSYLKNNRITTALLLAAGKGSRLFPITKDAPKCLTLVNETSMLDRLITNLKEQGFKHLIVVTGYKKEAIIDFLGTEKDGLSIEYVHNPIYATTNNIYSLWLARNVIKTPFVLFESDLVLETSLLDKMVFADKMAVAKMQKWLNGTTVSVNNENLVTHFQEGTKEVYSDTRYKTVNIYSFSLLTWSKISKKLNQYISEGSLNCYYETVFANMIDEKSISLEAVYFDDKPWYEIDTILDLTEAEKLFPTVKEHELVKSIL